MTSDTLNPTAENQLETRRIVLISFCFLVLILCIYLAVWAGWRDMTLIQVATLRLGASFSVAGFMATVGALFCAYFRIGADRLLTKGSQLLLVLATASASFVTFPYNNVRQPDPIPSPIKEEIGTPEQVAPKQLEKTIPIMQENLTVDNNRDFSKLAQIQVLIFKLASTVTVTTDNVSKTYHVTGVANELEQASYLYEAAVSTHDRIKREPNVVLQEKAIDDYEDALGLWIVSLGNNNSAVSQTERALADIYYRQGDFPLATFFYRRAC
jgi:hypothetical protein